MLQPVLDRVDEEPVDLHRRNAVAEAQAGDDGAALRPRHGCHDAEEATSVRSRKKYPSDTRETTDGDLNVAALPKAATGIEFMAFDEHAANRVEGFDLPALAPLFIENTVKMAYHGTVEIAENPVGVWLSRDALVLWNLQAGRHLSFHEGCMRGAQQLQVLTRYEVKAIAEIDDGSNNSRVRVIAA